MDRLQRPRQVRSADARRAGALVVVMSVRVSGAPLEPGDQLEMVERLVLPRLP